MTRESESAATGIESKTSRRSVLRSIGAASGVSVFNKLSSPSLKGVVGTTYDTLTHQQGPPVTGEFSRSDDELNGTLRMAGFEIPLSRLEMVEPGPAGDRFQTVLSENRFTKGKKGLKVNVRDHENQLSGYITRPGTGYGKLGFLIVNEQAPIASNTDAFVQPIEKWQNAPVSFEVPNRGVPTDSALSRLIHKLPTTAEVNGGDN